MKTRLVRECPNCHSTDLRREAEQFYCNNCTTMTYPHQCWVERQITEWEFLGYKPRG